jgi:hypothetical protein
MITYQDVFDVIKAALSQRPPGQRVLVNAHESAEILLLDYIEQFVYAVTAPPPRESHAYTAANEPTVLSWERPFENNDYSFVINGFGQEGTPVEIILLSKTPNDITISTFQAADVMAIAVPYSFK